MADEEFMFGDLFATVRVQDLPASREVVAVERQESGTWRVCGSAIANTDGIAELGIEGSKTSRVYAFAIDHWGEPFTPNKTVAYGDIIRPSVFLGWLYRVTAPGALPDEEPVWWNSTPGMPRPVGTAMAQAEMYFQPIAHGPVDIEWEEKGVGDPHWDKVVALLHFDGDVTDAKGNSWTLLGNTRFIPSPALGFGSAIEFYNKTVNDYIAVTPDSRFDFGSGDITIELMVDARDMSPNGATSVFIGSWTEGSKAGANWYLAAASRKFVFYANGIVSLTSSANLPLNMVHVAYTRSGNTHRLFIGGVKVAESVAAGAIPHTSHPIRIGRWDASNGWFDGVIDELRITKGVARYTENFAPPTEPFPNFNRL